MVWSRRVLTAALTVLLGVAVALPAVLLHGYWWGLALGLVTTASVLVALPGGWARLPFGLTWTALVVLGSVRRPEGDYLVGGDLRGYLLLGSCVPVLLGAIVGLRTHPAIEDEQPTPRSVEATPDD